MNNVVFTRVKFYRNVKDYKFTRKLEPNKKQEIENLVLNAVNGQMSIVQNPTADLAKRKLIETNKAYISTDNKISLNLFGDEHLTIISSAFGLDLSAFNNAKALADMLGNKISLSFSDQYGYLMSDITHLGAGVSLECEVNLSSLKSIGKIEQVKQNLTKLGYTLTETEQKNIYLIKTNCNLGLSETELVGDFEKTINKIVDLETESLNMLDINKHDELVDKVYRSLAIMGSAYMLNTDELNVYITNLLTGLNLGIVKIKQEDLCALFELSKNDSEFISVAQAKELAKQVKNIIKGVQYV